MRGRVWIAVIVLCYGRSLMARGIDKYITEQFGSLYSDDYRLFFKRADNDTPISPMHDIPL